MHYAGLDLHKRTIQIAVYTLRSSGMESRVDFMRN